jgi:hypothetical protein
MIKCIASYILFLFMAGVLLFSGAYGNSGGESLPSRKSFENIRLISAIAVIVLTIAAFGGLFILAAQLFAR